MSEEDNKEKTGVDKKGAGRRKLLKSVVAGGGAATVGKMLPDQWARPVVNSVMLPSHAQTSNSPFGNFSRLGRFGMNESDEQDVKVADQGFSEELLEFFTPAAHAGAPSVSEGMSFSANDSGYSQLCSEWNATTDMVEVHIDNTNPPSFISQCYLHNDRLVITGGVYDDSIPGWRVSFDNNVQNVSSTVDLTPGAGCTSWDQEGHCYMIVHP